MTQFLTTEFKCFVTRALLLASICLTGKSACAQYQPMVIDSASWIVAYEDVATPYTDNYYGYYILGDTLVNSVQYKKVYRIHLINELPNWPQPYKLDFLSLFGFIRESAQQVFSITLSQVFQCTANVEHLVYDFNFSTGSKFVSCLDVNYPDTLTVVNIDTIGGNKTFHLDNGAYYSEKLGSSNGPFEGLNIPVSGFYTYLQSYCVGDLNQCNILTEVSDLSVSRQLKVFPNPTTGRIAIQNLADGNYSIRITDNCGRPAYNEKIIIPNNNITLKLPDGFYSMLIDDLKGNIYTGKIIILNNQ